MHTNVVKTLIASTLATAALLVLSACSASPTVTGVTNRDREAARSVSDYLLRIDDFDWPRAVRVSGKTVTLIYPTPVKREFARELSFEVSNAIHYAYDQEGWRLVVENDEEPARRQTFSLPARVLSGETTRVGEFSITMPFNWNGEWTMSPDSTLGQPPQYLLTAVEPPPNDDFASYTSAIRIESYETSQAAEEAHEQLAEARHQAGWSSEPPLRLDRGGFRGSVARFVGRGPNGPQVVTDLILISPSDRAMRIVRSDKDAADRPQTTRRLDDVAARLIKLLQVSSEGD